MDWQNDSARFKYLWKSAGDPLSLTRSINDYDAIIYTAALADVPYCIQNPDEAIQVNVSNTAKFLELLRQTDYPGRLIVMSSESIYGHQPEVPIHENRAIPRPGNIYGATKLAQETMAMTYAKGYGIKTTVLRSATMFGPYGRMQQAMPIFIRQALMNDDITLEGDGIKCVV